MRPSGSGVLPRFRGFGSCYLVATGDEPDIISDIVILVALLLSNINVVLRFSRLLGELVKLIADIDGAGGGEFGAFAQRGRAVQGINPRYDIAVAVACAEFRCRVFQESDGNLLVCAILSERRSK